jgi:hypothetical protein
MGDENRVYGVEGLTNARETPGEFADAETGVDKNTRFGRGEKRRIAGTTAGEDAEPDRNKSPSFCFSNAGGVEAMAVPRMGAGAARGAPLRLRCVIPPSSS